MRVGSSDKPISISKIKGGQQTTALITEEEVFDLKNLDKRIPLTLHQAVALSREESKIFGELAILKGEIKGLSENIKDREAIQLMVDRLSSCSDKLFKSQALLGKNPKAGKFIDELFTDVFKYL